MAIQYKRLTDKADLLELERLEGEIWSPGSVIPLHMTLTMAKFGGLFLGAYDNDKMIGFLYSFPGMTDGEHSLCSHMLGFLPDYRKRGLGVVMKWMQREEALRLGHKKITWTFDPLETVNAYLNIAKLGGIVRQYLPNCYGELNDDMNRGLPTDRFLIEWFIESERVDRHHQNQRVETKEPGTSAITYQIDQDGNPAPLEANLQLDAERILVTVPAFFQQVKKSNFPLAAKWRSVTGDVFQHYFRVGYAVTGVSRHETEPVVTYLLERRPLQQILR